MKLKVNIMKKITDRSLDKQFLLLTFIACVPLFFSQSLLAQNIDFPPEPLTLSVTASKPNIMLLIDDSGSMDTDDIFYTPGYDFNENYECAAGSTVLTANNASTVVVKIYKDNGTSYYSYGGIDYFLAEGLGNFSIEPAQLSERYKYFCTSSTNEMWECDSDIGADAALPPCNLDNNTENARVNGVGFNETDGDTFFASNNDSLFEENDCKASALPDGSVDGVPNWRYVAGTLWSRSRDGTDGSVKWIRPKNLNFAKAIGDGLSLPKACFDTESDYNVKLKASDCTSSDVFCSSASETSEIYSGNFLNWYLSNSSHQYFDFDQLPNGGLVSDLSAPSDNFDIVTGYKQNTSPNMNRMDVANDVAALFVKGAVDLRVGLANYAYTNGTDITHTFVELGNLSTNTDRLLGPIGTENTFAVNRLSLLNTIRTFSAGGGTPLGEAMAEIGMYFAHAGTGNGSLLDIDRLMSNATGATKNVAPEVFFKLNSDDLYEGDEDNDRLVKVRSVLFDETSQSITSTTVHSSLEAQSDTAILPPMNSDEFCRQNYLVALTDGDPEEYDIDFSNSDLKNANDGVSYYVDDVAKAMFELDLRPDINNKKSQAYVNNVKTDTIAFSNGVNGTTLLQTAANVGGGNFYQATDGTALAAAFADIGAGVEGDAASISAVAVSSVAELTTENFVYQATYETEFWSGLLNAYFLTAAGQFSNANFDQVNNIWVATGTPGNDITDISAVWNSGDVVANMYLVQGDTTTNDENALWRDIDNRRIYTLNNTGTAGIPFTTAGFTDATGFKPSLNNDINTIAASDRDNFINYIRGDISHEIANALGDSETFRQRVVISSADNIDLTALNTAGSSETFSGQASATAVVDIARGSIVGDMINSSPTYVADPPRPWSNITYGNANNLYTDFEDNNANRPGVLYIGSNSGMVHAITTTPVSIDLPASGYGYPDTNLNYPAGAELFAYIPSFIGKNVLNDGGNASDANTMLHTLANPDYEHRYFVDAKPTASDVFMDFDYVTGNPVDPEWRTVLVGGAGAGGMGFYALDITCPVRYGGACSNNTDVFGPNDVLWEFDTTHDADIGLTLSQPVIAKVNFNRTIAVGSEDPNGNGNGRWAAIVNNGYNSANGNAAIFILFLDGGLNGSWVEGQDYIKLYATDDNTNPFNADNDDTDGSPNGLSSPQVVDTNDDGVIDRIYAGDLKGNMWVWDVRSNQTQANLEADSPVPLWTVNKLFAAGDSITTAPQLARDSQQSVASTCQANIMVMFGTGKYLEISDIEDPSVQSVYGVHDACFYTDPNGLTANLTQANLTERTLTATTIDGNQVRTISGPSLALNGSTNFGWFVNLPESGERYVFDGFVVNDIFVFNTLTPDTTACSGGSTGWQMGLDWTTGLNADRAIFDTTADGEVNSDDNATWVGFKCEGACAGSPTPAGDNLISGGENPTSKKFNVGETVEGRRLSWEEVFPFGILK